MAANTEKRRHAAKVVSLLAKHYGEAKCSLDFRSPLELLVATVLSAQCTDKRVNLVTPSLFAKYRSAADYAKGPVAQLEKDIQSTGFFRNKAKNIQACCNRLLEEYGGEVPNELEKLVELPGVGRKTANVVLGTGFGIASGVVVDTHVGRIARRLGLTEEKDPEKVERDLMALLPQKEWINLSHRMIHFGREYCTARSPKCSECPMGKICPRIGVESDD